MTNYGRSQFPIGNQKCCQSEKNNGLIQDTTHKHAHIHRILPDINSNRLLGYNAKLVTAWLRLTIFTANYISEEFINLSCIYNDTRKLSTVICTLHIFQTKKKSVHIDFNTKINTTIATIQIVKLHCY